MNKSLYHENLDYLKNSKRKFSVSSSKLSNLDKLLSDLEKHQQEMQKFKAELDEKKEKEQQREQDKLLQQVVEKEKQQYEEETKQELAKEKTTFSSQAENKLDELIDKHSVVEDKFINQLTKGYGLLGEKKTSEVHAKFQESKERLTENIENRAMDLEDEFRGEIKSVAYYQQKIDIEAARFKNMTQILAKEEKEMDKELKNKGNYSQYKEEYEKERSEWIEQHKTDVKSCRQEKNDIKEQIKSNLESSSQMAESLMQESGPDYTGGDD